MKGSLIERRMIFQPELPRDLSRGIELLLKKGFSPKVGL